MISSNKKLYEGRNNSIIGGIKLNNLDVIKIVYKPKENIIEFFK